MLHLFFRVHGPLCSWGDIAPGTHRPTLAMPTRSAILGLVASALGVGRNDEERHASLSGALGVGVRMESAGAIMSDYHTVQTPTRERRVEWRTRRDELTQAASVNTILSKRDHVEDAAYTVALWGGGADDLQKIAAALDRPRFPPYLGRRSCPTALPFFAHVVEAVTLKEAFDRASFPSEDMTIVSRLRRSAAHAFDHASRRVEFDAHPAHGYDHVWSHPQRDDPASRLRWTFRERAVHTAAHPLEGAP